MEQKRTDFDEAIKFTGVGLSFGEDFVFEDKAVRIEGRWIGAIIVNGYYRTEISLDSWMDDSVDSLKASEMYRPGIQYVVIKREPLPPYGVDVYTAVPANALERRAKEVEDRVVESLRG